MKVWIKGVVELMGIIAALAVTPPISMAQKVTSPKRLDAFFSSRGEAVTADTIVAPMHDATIMVEYKMPRNIKTCMLDIIANGVTIHDLGTPPTSASMRNISSDHPWYPKSESVPTKLIYTCKDDAGQSYSRTMYLRAHK